MAVQVGLLYKVTYFGGHVALAISIIVMLYWKRNNNTETQECSYQTQFVAIIDAGSSGSRVHIYERSPQQGSHEEWQDHKDKSVYDNLIVNLPEPSKKNDAPLSNFANNPQNAGTSLKGLLQFAKDVVPQCLIPSTPIFLLATAGLRLLSNDVQENIMNSCRIYLESSGFQTKDEWVRIIDGKEEATFAYLAVNYLFGQVVSTQSKEAGTCQRLVGVFELGGASFQAAFQASDESVEQQQSVDQNVLGVGLRLYANSFLSLGLDEAFIEVHKWLAESMIAATASSPCMPKGEIQDGLMKGTGNFKGCRKLVNVFYRRHEPCVQATDYEGDQRIDGDCNLQGQTVPDATSVSKGAMFVATENFFYTIKNLNLPMDASLAEVEKAGRDFCRLSWQQLQRRYRDVPERYLLKTCFGAVLVIQLLHDSFGIPMDERGRVLFVNKVNDVSLDWTLGVLVQQLNSSNITPHNT
eukprot:TRINITY_DN14902_c0_g1_i4.p1 TRINITY_DN14902_c0_g1~~TRINITY_DN14902_c0_g1_i4.p1  ORF type:complete len:477 (-),score=61.74 TRINITY_DN14902_c0_g1_i4:858-2258(-)